MTKEQEKALTEVVKFARKNHIVKFKCEFLGIEFELAPRPVKHRNTKTTQPLDEEPQWSEDDILEWSSRGAE